MEIVKTTYAGPGKQSQQISAKDRRLITSNKINSQFGENNDYLEIYIYGENGELILSDYDGSDYYPKLINPETGTYSNIVLEPEKDLKSRGFNRGNLTIQYNFYKKLFNSDFGTYYWIKEISPSRTELRVASQVIPNSLIESGFADYQVYSGNNNYYPIFYLNFGNNRTIIANNAALTEDDESSYILIKLYEPLPSDFDLKTEFWIVDKIADSVSYNVNIQVQADEVRNINQLKGPNYTVSLNVKTGQTTPYYNYNNLINSPISESFQKLISYYQDKSVDINIDYSNFANFVHFSSAVQRVNNFVSKLETIEAAYANIAYQQSIIGGSTNVNIANNTISAEQQIIDSTVKNFDIYEYFLYFESSSWAWPKSNPTQPYQLYSVTSSQAQNFLGGVDIIPTATTQSLLWSASYHDSTNKDLFHNSIPQYLLDDPSNEPYITFLDMIGQHFDNIWVYYKDVTNRFNATNNPDTGISLDLVSDALRGLGFQLFTNTNVSDNLYYTLFGINQGGSLLPPTGSEIITNYITSSIPTLPAETIQDEIYKRLYHNIPYLYKTKGTVQSIKSLISIFGIPESILKVREFGGNYTGSLDGIFDLNTTDYKISIITGSDGTVTGSATISSSLLSPYTTIQQYQGNNRVNINTIEVGFSPADVINDNIIAFKETVSGLLGNQAVTGQEITTQDDLSIEVTTSEGNTFNIDELVGSPGYRYSSSYAPLVSASNDYFASYTQANSIWEYIRLLKFYNNSLFKIIKTFVPARANVSTGLIVKSHMYERNKYARHEPEVTFNDYSQSIEMLEFSAGVGGAITGSTAWSGFLISAIGPVAYTSSQNQELYTGEFSGSNIIVTDGQALEQGDYISNLTGSIETYNYGALYQNITSSVRSQNFVDLDYNSNQLKPVNYNIVTYSLNELNTNAYSAYTNPNNPFAQLQDYNYVLQRSIIPRYVGSETISSTYNEYTEGDQSYGKTAAIDKIKYQYGYLVDIYSASKFLPNRSNAQIKYVIDNAENVLDLTKENKNIFTVQNIYKSGETVNVSLFEYYEDNPYTQQLVKQDIAIYEGGFRYLPILHNVSGSSTLKLNYKLTNPIRVDVAASSGSSGATSSLDPSDPLLQPGNYSASLQVEEYYYDSIYERSEYTFFADIFYKPGGVLTEVTQNIRVTFQTNFDVTNGGCAGSTKTITLTITNGNSSVSGLSNSIGKVTLQSATRGNLSEGDRGVSGYDGDYWPLLSFGYDNCSITITQASVSTTGRPGGGTSVAAYTYYRTFITSSNPCLYFRSESNEIVFDATMSYYYNNPDGNFFNDSNGPLILDSTSDTNWTGSGLPPVILPFTLDRGDKISIYDVSSSLGWSEFTEYTIKNVRTTGSRNTVTSSVLLAEVAEQVNLASFSSGSGIPIESITGAPYRACRYIVWKHVPDETNVMLRYDPLDNSIVENGILFPEYIDPPVRDNTGNVIKSLKQQNLI